MEENVIEHPKHYNTHPSGVEAVEICELLTFNLGCALKYLWRCDLKHDNPTEDLKKALWFVRREIRVVHGSAPHVEKLPEPIRLDYVSDRFFGRTKLEELASKAIACETRTWVAGAMAHIVRGCLDYDDADLAVAVHYIERYLEEVPA